MQDKRTAKWPAHLFASVKWDGKKDRNSKSDGTEREKETENGKEWNTNRKKWLFMIMGVNKVKYTIKKKYLKKKGGKKRREKGCLSL